MEQFDTDRIIDLDDAMEMPPSSDLLGLQGQLATIPIADLQRIQVPALIKG